MKLKLPGKLQLADAANSFLPLDYTAYGNERELRRRIYGTWRELRSSHRSITMTGWVLRGMARRFRVCGNRFWHDLRKRLRGGRYAASR